MRSGAWSLDPAQPSSAEVLCPTAAAATRAAGVGRAEKAPGEITGSLLR